MRFSLRVIAAMAVLCAVSFMANRSLAQTRSTPNASKRNYQPGTGVDRNGIIRRSSPHRRSTNYVVPRGSFYYYGYQRRPYYSVYPGRYAYYYENDICPYCGVRGCGGGCRYGRGPIYLPPLVVNPSQYYGPRVANQLLGVGDQQPRGNRGGGPIQQAAAKAPIPPPKLSNPSARALAWKFVEYGDRHFKNGDYRKAAERYRKARNQADDLPDIHFREAFAELGAGKYADAVSAVRKGLALKPDWPQSGFVLEELYPTPEAKRSAFRKLNVFVNQHPNDADGLFLLGMLEHFDGREAAGELRMRRVAELTGLNQHALAFLPPAPQRPAPLPEPQPEAHDPAPAGKPDEKPKEQAIEGPLLAPPGS